MIGYRERYGMTFLDENDVAARLSGLSPTERLKSKNNFATT